VGKRLKRVAQGNPISLSGGVLVLPILPDGQQKAFYDVALPVANAVSQLLAERSQTPSRVLPASDTLTLLKTSGLAPLYVTLVQQFNTTGQVDIKVLQSLVDKLLVYLPPGQALGINHVALVTANADLNNPSHPGSLWQQIVLLTSDVAPGTANLFVTATLQIYSTTGTMDGIFMINQHKMADGSLGMHRFVNVTPSVYQDQDSTIAFTTLGKVLAKRLLTGL
jgi:hypothetical protein